MKQIHWQTIKKLRADFQEGDEDSNFSVFRVRRFTEWPEPLHWIAFSVESLPNPWFTELPPPFSLKKIIFFTEKCFVASPKNRLWKIQWRRRPKITDFYPLSWSKVSWGKCLAPLPQGRVTPSMCHLRAAEMSSWGWAVGRSRPVYQLLQQSEPESTDIPRGNTSSCFAQSTKSWLTPQTLWNKLLKVRPVQFGALPAAAEQLLTNLKPLPWPKIEPNFEALSWF